MKLFLDFLPIILFFGAFKLADADAEAAARFATEHLGFIVSGGVVGATEAPVLLATVVVIVATLAQITLLLAMRRKVDTMLWVTFFLIGILGGATVWFHDPTFIKWKPSALYWAMALGLWISSAVFGKNLLRTILSEQVVLGNDAWKRLNIAWALFFAVMGVLNLWIAYSFSTSTWATFKVFGGSGLMVIFMLAQGPYVMRHMKLAEDAQDAERLAGSPVGEGDTA
ncbi:MAG: septation protein A [Caldimonas sp.]